MIATYPAGTDASERQIVLCHMIDDVVYGYSTGNRGMQYFIDTSGVIIEIIERERARMLGDIAKSIV